MADRSREPADNISMHRLERALAGLAEEVRHVRRSGEAQVAKSQADLDAQRRAAAREAAKRQRQQKEAPPDPTRSTAPGQAEVDAATRIKQAAAETERLEARTAEHLVRQQRALGAVETGRGDVVRAQERRAREARRTYQVTERSGRAARQLPFGVVDDRGFEIARTVQRQQAEKLAADLDRVERSLNRKRAAPTFPRPSPARQAALYAEAMGLTAREVLARSQTGVDIGDKPYKAPRLSAADIQREIGYLDRQRTAADNVAAANARAAEAKRAEADVTKESARVDEQKAAAARQAADEAQRAERQRPAQPGFAARDRYRALLEEAKRAQQVAQDARKAADQAEGRQKAQQTRLRKLEESPFVGASQWGNQERKIFLAREAVERARVKAAAARSAVDPLQAEATRAIEAAHEARLAARKADEGERAATAEKTRADQTDRAAKAEQSKVRAQRQAPPPAPPQRPVPPSSLLPVPYYRATQAGREFEGEGFVGGRQTGFGLRDPAGAIRAYGEYAAAVTRAAAAVRRLREESARLQRQLPQAPAQRQLPPGAEQLLLGQRPIRLPPAGTAERELARQLALEQQIAAVRERGAIPLRRAPIELPPAGTYDAEARARLLHEQYARAFARGRLPAPQISQPDVRASAARAAAAYRDEWRRQMARALPAAPVQRQLPPPQRLLPPGAPPPPPVVPPQRQLGPGRQPLLLSAGPPDLADVLGDADRVARQATATQDQNTRSTQQNAAVKRRAALSQAGFTRSISHFNQEANLSEAVYTRNGALTTEFLSAVARGQVTVRELGRQVGLTIGKFAGWTTAAAATYGMVRAVGVLGRGAVHGLDAVNKLERVVGGLDTTRAQQQLRDLAERFNLPLDEVGEAAFGAGKVFKDQDDVFKGTEAALFAVKVGELDAATATQALTAIVNGLGAGVEGLGPIFDKINHLTNSFGGNVGQLTVGMAKSAGAFRNAAGEYRASGEDVNYLLALLQTGARVTSYTSTEIGTALARTAERLQQPVRRQKVADLLGMSEDDAGNIVKVWERIFERIREGADDQEIAQIMSTVSTPLLATRQIPIAKREGMFRDILAATGPESVGSAERELDKVKEAASEQIAAAKIAFANLGSALATSGALEPLLALFKGVVGLIKGATTLVEVFSKLPGPLKTAAAFAGQMLAAIALMRRLDVGGVIDRQTGGRGTFGLARSPRALERANIDQALSTERAFFQEQRHRYTTEGARVSFRGREALRAAEAIADTPEKVALLDPDKHREYERHITAANNALDESTDLTRRAEQARLEDVRLQRQQAGFRRRTRRRFFFFGRRGGIDTAVAAEGIEGQRPVSQERITTTESVPIIAGNRAVADGARRAEAAQREATRTARDTARQASRAGISGRALGNALSVAVIGLRNARRGIGNARAGMSNLGPRMLAFGSSLRGIFGPLDAIIAASIIIAARVQAGKDKLAEVERLAAPTADAEALKRDAEKVLKGRSLGEELESILLGAVREIVPGVKTPFLGDLKTPQEQLEEKARQALRTRVPRLRERQAKGELLTTTQILQRFRERMADADTAAEKEAAIARGRRELEDSFLKTYGYGKRGKLAVGKVTDTFRIAANSIRDGSRTLQENLDALQDALEVGDFTLGVQNRIRRRGLTRKSVGELAAAATSAREKAANVADPDGVGKKEVSDLLDAAEEAEQALIDAARQRLDDVVATARTPREAGRASSAFLSVIERARQQRRSRLANLGVSSRDARRDRARLQAANRADEAALTAAQARAAISPILPGPGDPIGGRGFAGAAAAAEVLAIKARIAKRTAEITKLGGQIKNDDKAAEDLRKELGLSRAAFRALRRQIVRDQFELEQEARDADIAVAVSQTADPLEAARRTGAGLRAKTQALRRMFAQHAATRTEIQNAIAAENENLKQIAQAELAESESRRQLATSQFNLTNPSPEAAAQRAIYDARQKVADVRSKGRLVAPSELNDALRELNEALRARADQVSETAQELIKAQAEYDKSLTDDPVKQARIDAVAARKLEAFARSPAEKLNARAATRNAQKAVIQQRVDSRLDDIDFNLTMERITRDEAIRQLQDLTKIDGIKKQARRDILRKIKALQDDDGGELDLALGNIKLPTAYEVRRAIDEATAARSAPALSRMDVMGHRTANYGGNTVNINVNGPQDYDELGRVLETHVSGTAKGMARAGLHR